MKKFTYSGAIIKSILALLIALVPALYILLNVGPVFVGWMGLALSIITGIAWFVINKSLWTLNDASSVAKGWILMILGSLLLGIFFGNSIWIAIYYTAVYGSTAVFAYVTLALIYSTIATITATIGSIIVGPKLKASSSSFVSKFIKAVIIVAVGYAAISMIAFIMAMLGLTGLWDLLMGAIYGVGPISIAISVILVALAAFGLLKSYNIAYNLEVQGESPNKEFAAGLMIASAIVTLFVEIFKLILKILVRSND